MNKLWLLCLGLALPLAAQAPPGRLRGLLVGLSHYSSSRFWGPIHGQEDAQALMPVLRSRFQAQDGDFRLLLGAEATRGAILSELESLCQKSQSGDTVVFYYSGHGSVVPDQPGGDELDGLDECLVPYDAPSPNSRTFAEQVLRDDQVRDFVSRVRQKVGDQGQVLLIIDSCHSGTMNRAAELASLRPRTSMGTALSQDGCLPEQLPDRVAVLSACQADEIAADDQNQRGGVFTKALLHTLEDPLLKPTDDYRALMARLRKNGRFLQQNPRFEGQWDLAIGGGRLLPLPLVARLRSTKGEIDRGELAGFYVGSQVRMGDQQGTVVQSSPWVAQVRFPKTPEDKSIGQAVEMLAQSSAPQGLRVFSTMPLPEGVQSCPEAALANLIVEPKGPDQLLLWSDSGESWTIERSQLPTWILRLEVRQTLTRWVHDSQRLKISWQPGRYLRPDAPGGPEGFVAEAMEMTPEGFLKIAPDQQVEMEVHNPTTQPCYVQLLNFLSDGRTQAMVGSERLLKPGQKTQYALQFETTPLFAEGVKVVASLVPLDLEGANTRGQDHPLARFLGDTLRRGAPGPVVELSDPSSYCLSETYFVRCTLRAKE